MVRLEAKTRDRLRSAAAVGAIHAVIGYVLVVGLGVGFVPEAPRDALKILDLAPEPPPPPPLVEPAKVEAEKTAAKAEKPQGAASPANLRDTPSPVVAPPPAIPLPLPSPVVAAPVAGEGSRDSAGASDVPGPGTGSGGIGTGLGSGEAGDGTGGGGGGGMARGARRIRGAIYTSDWPHRRQGIWPSGIVHLRFVVAPNGRVPRCDVTRTSGDRELDETTCRLIKRRFRYLPARDGDGRAIAQVVPGTHDWGVGPEPEPIDVEPDIIDDEPY